VSEVELRDGSKVEIRTPAQVLIRSCLERGTIVLPKSSHRERIAESGQVFDFGLSDDETLALDALDRTGGTGRARGDE
jgi:2,5-diketo-D-gluconate reductase A